MNMSGMKKEKMEEKAGSVGTEEKEIRPSEIPLWKEYVYLAGKVAVLAGIVFVVFQFIFGAYRCSDQEMSHAIRDGDLVFFFRLDKNYHAGDVAVLSVDGQLRAGRVAAVAGDTVDITEDGLVINGVLQYDPEVTGETRRYAEGIELPVTLEKDQIFVLADSRENATDSRVFGPVLAGDTAGKVIMLLRRRGI